VPEGLPLRHRARRNRHVLAMKKERVLTLVPRILQVKCKIELSSGKGLSDFVEFPYPSVHL